MNAHRLGMVLHPTKNVSASVEIINDWAASSGVPVLVLEPDAARGGAMATPVSKERFAAEVDGVISLGGDGTMLGAMRLVSERRVPVLGVNYGNVGFLVEVEPRNLAGAIKRLVAGEFSIEPHHSLVATMSSRPPASALDSDLAVTLDSDGETTESYIAFNDLVLARIPGFGAVGANLSISGDRYGFYRCDALVVATPAGSTAYNYSAGGPVISPAMEAMVISPVAPMTGISRAVVLGSNEVVELWTTSQTQRIMVEVDGAAVTELGPDQRVRITMGVDAGQVVRLDAAAHNQRGRVKLSLLDLPLQPDQLLELVPPEIRSRLTGLRDELG